jgi:hypothetical protein
MRGIFISYRRQDSQSAAGRLADHLKEQMPSTSIFRDVETIEPGVDFVDAINHAMKSCAVLLAVIGTRWMTVTGANGRRRLDDPHDYNRLEIATALKRSDVRVIPVLVEGAVMPATDDLPEDLKPLSRRNAVELTDKRWEYDVGQLIETLEKILDNNPPPLPEPAAIVTPSPAVKPTPTPQPASPNRHVALAAAGVLGAMALGFWLDRDAPAPADPLPANPIQTSPAPASQSITPSANSEPTAETSPPEPAEPAPNQPAQNTHKTVIRTARPVTAMPTKPASEKPVAESTKPAQSGIKPAELEQPTPAPVKTVKDEPLTGKPATSKRIIVVAWADTTGKSFWSGLSDQAYSGRMAELAVSTLRGELPNGFSVHPDIDKKSAVEMAIKKSDSTFRRICEAENAAWVFAAHVQENFAISSAPSAYWPELKLAAWRCGQGSASAANHSLSPGNGDDFPFSREMHVAMQRFVAARRPGGD